MPMGLYDRGLLADLKQLGYTAVHTTDRMPGADGAWLQPRFSIVADDTDETVERYVSADQTHVGMAWQLAKSRMKRLR